MAIAGCGNLKRGKGQGAGEVAPGLFRQQCGIARRAPVLLFMIVLVWCSVITLNHFRAVCADAALLVVAIALL